MPRTALTADATIHINGYTGNDSTGDGTSLSPFATLQHAREFAQRSFDLMGQYAVTYDAYGDFTAGVCATGPLVGQRSPNDETFAFVAGSVITAPTNSRALEAVYGAMFTVRQVANNLTIRAPGSEGVGIAASEGGFINVIDTITLSNCGGYAIQTAWKGTVIANSLYATGSGQAFVAACGGVVQLNPGNATYFMGLPSATYSKATVWAYGTGVIGINGQTFAGTVFGPRYAAEMGGIISTGVGATYVPGSTAGYANTGGQYQ